MTTTIIATPTLDKLNALLPTMRMESREYQRRIVTKVADMFKGEYVDQFGNAVGDVSSILIESPTGSGKTVMGLLAARMLQEAMPNLHVIWVAMRRVLLGQAAKANLEMEIGVKNIHFVSMFDHHPEAALKAKADGHPILIVSDEAQHDAAASMGNLHSQIKADYILGLTATPFRTDSLKLCFQMVVKDAGIHRLIADNFLSKFDHYTLPDWRPITVAKAYVNDPERWGKSAFYFKDLARCFKLQELFNRKKIRCDVITGSSDYESQLKRFEDGEYPCLINCMKLTEGFDCPSLKTVWVRDSSRGPTIQMSGRVLRLFEGQRKQIVQSFDTKHPFTKTATPHNQYTWEDGWKALKVNENTDQIAVNTITALAGIQTTLPKFMLDKLAKRKKLPNPPV